MSFPKEYQLPLTYDEAGMLKKALFAAAEAAGGFFEPQGSAYKELWHKVATLVSAEATERGMWKEFEKWGTN